MNSDAKFAILPCMQVPIRKSEQTKRYSDPGGPILLTPAGIKRLEETLHDLQKNQLPPAIADVQRTGEMGDFSENAAYQEAKARMRHIHSRIAILKDRLSRAQIIKYAPSGFVEIGSTVVLKINGEEKTFEIVGPSETNPTHGRISHLSPLGAALMNHAKRDQVKLQTGDKEIVYEIINVQ